MTVLLHLKSLFSIFRLLMDSSTPLFWILPALTHGGCTIAAFEYSAVPPERKAGKGCWKRKFLEVLSYKSTDASIRLFNRLKSTPRFSWMAVSQVSFGLGKLKTLKPVPRPVTTGWMAEPYLYTPLVFDWPTVP